MHKSVLHFAVTVAVFCSAMVCLSCGGTSETAAASSTSESSAALPRFDAVSIVVLQNAGFDDVIGSSSMPYLNSLTNQNGLATNYNADSSRSIADQFALTTGKATFFEGTFVDDNIVRELSAANKTWKSYAENLPQVGYLGFDRYPYVKRHNPFAYFSDVVDSPAQQANLVPFSQFASDLQNNSLPQYSYLVPNQLNNGHDCPAEKPDCTKADRLAAADQWLQTNIGPLLASERFRSNGLLVVVFDSAVSSEVDAPGGKVAAVIISPKAKPGFRSNTLLQHASTLRLMAEGLGLSKFPGKASNAPNMADFFVAAP